MHLTYSQRFRRIAFAFALAVAVCSGFTGAVANAEEKPVAWKQAFDDISRSGTTWSSQSGALSTALANPPALKRTQYITNERTYTLHDGTRLGGLYFASSKDEPAPLLIATFGFLADRWSQPAAQFVKKFVEPGLISANVLIVDHPTSGGFYALNGLLSHGGYDEGQLLVDLARQFKTANPAQKIFLLGISMGGMGVIHASLESDRQSASLFSGIITFSAATKLSTTPGWQLSAFPVAPGTTNPWGSGYGNRKNGLYKYGLNKLIDHFTEVVNEQSDPKFSLSEDKVANFFYDNFSTRLTHLRSLDLPHEIDISTPEAYAQSCNLDRWISSVRTPLLMVHSVDDPSIPYEQFHELEFIGKNNPNVSFLEVTDGGHWGFSSAFSPEWVAQLINRVLANSSKPSKL